LLKDLGNSTHLCETCITPKLVVVRDIANIIDENSNKYFAAIQKMAKEHDVLVLETIVQNEKEFKEVASLEIPTLVLQPCQFDTSIIKHNMEKYQTVRAIKSIIKESNIDKPTVIIFNRSDLIGKPLALALLDKDINATPIVIHSKTPHERAATLLEQADIVVLATSKTQNINVKGKVVIDISGDNSSLKDQCRYVSMSEVGKRTTQRLIKDVRRWWYGNMQEWRKGLQYGLDNANNNDNSIDSSAGEAGR
jgi:hypothetical protein